MLLLLVGVLAGFLVPLAASAQSINDVRDAYLSGQYQRVVELLEPAVGSQRPANADPVLVAEFRRYLGAAYVLVHREVDGTRQFEWLLREAATDAVSSRLIRQRLEEVTLNPARFVEEVQQVFSAERARLLARADQQQTDAAASADQQRTACLAGFESLTELAGSTTIEIDNDELPSWVPFGVGQFSNGDRSLGLVMAITQSASALGAFGTLATYIYLESVGRDERGRLMPGFADALVGIQVANIITASVFLVLAVAGIVEARTSWRPTRTETREREIPEELRDPVRFCGSEAGITLCF